jgi:GMP synthase-like glutamine amidotransferase
MALRGLVVNNDTEPDNWALLQEVVAAAGYIVTPVHHSAIGAIDARGYDFAILSGGWWASDQDVSEVLTVYAEELRFIEESGIPILGICVGMLLMHVALDQAAPVLDEKQFGYKEIDITIAGRALFGFPETLSVFKNHDRAVIETDPTFEVLATSDVCTEIILHKTKQLLGVQFHPENERSVADSVLLVKILIDGLLRVPAKRSA